MHIRYLKIFKSQIYAFPISRCVGKYFIISQHLIETLDEKVVSGAYHGKQGKAGNSKIITFSFLHSFSNTCLFLPQMELSLTSDFNISLMPKGQSFFLEFQLKQILLPNSAPAPAKANFAGLS